MPKLSELGLALRESPIRRVLKIIADAKASGIDLIHFSAGQPSLPPEDEVLRHTVEVILKNSLDVSSYTPTMGLRDLRIMISEDLKRYGGIDVDPETEITVTEGASEGMLLAILSTIDPGDEVIIFDPSYVSYPFVIEIARGKPIPLIVRVEDGYQPDVETLKELITARTRAIFFATPDNPTGRILDIEAAKAIIDLAVDNDLWLIIDEAYKHLIYEGEHLWIARLDDAWERSIFINSFSKDAAMTGWRLGYLYGPREVIESAIKFKQYITLCSNTPAQIAAIKYLQPEIKEIVLERTIKIYRERRDVMYDAISKFLPDAKTIKSPGAMYLFVDMRSYLEKLGINDEQFAEILLKEEHVAVVPGSGFGRGGKGHLRFTFVGEPKERIIEGIKRIADLLEKLETGKIKQPSIT